LLIEALRTQFFSLLDAIGKVLIELESENDAASSEAIAIYGDITRPLTDEQKVFVVNLVDMELHLLKQLRFAFRVIELDVRVVFGATPFKTLLVAIQPLSKPGSLSPGEPAGQAGCPSGKQGAVVASGLKHTIESWAHVKKTLEWIGEKLKKVGGTVAEQGSASFHKVLTLFAAMEAIYAILKIENGLLSKKTWAVRSINRITTTESKVNESFDVLVGVYGRYCKKVLETHVVREYGRETEWKDYYEGILREALGMIREDAPEFQSLLNALNSGENEFVVDVNKRTRRMNGTYPEKLLAE
jgi:hypothetical protein